MLTLKVVNKTITNTLHGTNFQQFNNNNQTNSSTFKMKSREAMLLIKNSTVSRENSRTNFTHVRLSGKQHSASPHAILLPLNLTLVKFIPNFTPTRAITYTYI